MKSPKSVRRQVTNIIPFGLRMQPDLRKLIEKASEDTGRSLNAEICIRLHQTFMADNKADELLAVARAIHADIQTLKTVRAPK